MRRFLLALLFFPGLAIAQPPPDDGGGEVVDILPQIVGGMEALAAAVVYPEAAERDGVEGTVVVRFVVDETGAVINPEVMRTPSELLSEAALAAVRGVRFTPAEKDGQPVRMMFAVPIQFRLSGGLPPILPGPPEPEVYEVVEVQPVLIGGLDGLQRRVEYPLEARRDGIEGVVVIQFVVGTEGQVEDPVVLRSAHPLLDAAALAAVRQSRFEPGTQRGVPVRVRFAVPVTFRLD